MNKRGLPSSPNSKWPLSKKRRKFKESLKQRETAFTTYVPEIELPQKLVPDLQEERCKSKGDLSGPEENYLRGQARVTRVDTPDRSPNTRVTNCRSRIQGTDDPAITVQDKVDTPDSKIARRQMEVQRVGGPHYLKSLLGMSRTGESISQVPAEDSRPGPEEEGSLQSRRIQQGRSNPYLLRSRGDVTKKAGSQPSGRSVQAQEGPVRPREKIIQYSKPLPLQTSSTVQTTRSPGAQW
ncbi:hypothetical protein TNIN_178621 [Trichonephila inaurata madagascariensis]|uniref:Uncharacterized protein n=1 Tax=Trichonephila inaurata madagascariensis TaxID=2747483 RepID=A0A8X6Y0H8_9ARAC|nr:hypothetical protein TNIN_178621 [Trichonephila inaurata madagascariensis]